MRHQIIQHNKFCLIKYLLIENQLQEEGDHLTLPAHILSVQVKSGACYITGQWVGSSE